MVFFDVAGDAGVGVVYSRVVVVVVAMLFLSPELDG